MEVSLVFSSFFRWGPFLFLVFSSLVQAKELPRQVLGLSADYPPFEYRENGKIVGFDVDLAHELAKKLNFSLEIQNSDFSSLIPALSSGRVDFVMSGMSMTPERKQNVVFSEPYYASRVAVLLREEKVWDSQKQLTGLRVGVQLGTTLEKFLKSQQALFPGMKIVSLSRYPLLIQELKVKSLDAVLVEDAQVPPFVKANPFLKGFPLSTLTKNEEGYAIAFSKKKPTTEVQRWNEALAALKKEGVLQQLSERWFPHASPVSEKKACGCPSK